MKNFVAYRPPRFRTTKRFDGYLKRPALARIRKPVLSLIASKRGPCGALFNLDQFICQLSAI